MADFRPYQGTLSFNGKIVHIHFNEGWGEPGTWVLKFEENVDSTYVENITGTATQLDVLKSYTNEFKLEIFLTDWSAVGTEEDIVRTALNYVGYNDRNAEQDERRIIYLHSRVDEAKTVLKAAVQKYGESIAKDEAFVVSEASSKLDKLVEKFDRFELFEQAKRKEIGAVEQRLAVFNKLQNGEPVGYGWTNETFWNNFGDTTEAAIYKERLRTHHSQ